MRNGWILTIKSQWSNINDRKAEIEKGNEYKWEDKENQEEFIVGAIKYSEDLNRSKYI